jgi:hypothetical protein
MKKQSAHDCRHKPQQCETIKSTRIASRQVFHDADIPGPEEAAEIADRVNPNACQEARLTNSALKRKTRGFAIFFDSHPD